MVEVINKVGDILWSYLVIWLLIGCALYFTIRTRGVQFRMIPEMIRVMLGRDHAGSRKMGSFKAFSVSLASRVGTGNLAGVASAIFVGGPGAVFWMWVMALFGAATAFVEATLAQLFKKRGKDSFYGGPAYFIQTGIGSRWMAVVFSILMILTFSVCNQTVQSNTIVASISSSLGWNPLPVAIVVAVLSFIIVAGGIRRIAGVSSWLVPMMAIGYILLAIFIICANITSVPHVFRLIIDSAFGVRQAAGGMVGVAIMQGVRRGLFSNEAGEGSAPHAAAIAETSHPVKQGLVQSLGVFVDTIIICTCTAMIILLSGLYDCGQDGVILTTMAIESQVGAVGRYFTMVAVFLFAFSTIIGNYYYGESNIHYLFKKNWPVWVFRILTPFIVFFGALIELQTAWSLVDVAMALLTLCNLIALIILCPYVFRLLSDYMAQKKAGKGEPTFHKDTLPEIADKLESWD